MQPEIHLDSRDAAAASQSEAEPWTLTVAGRAFGWRQLIAVASLAMGAVVLAVGWVGVSQNTEVWEQLPYLLSGGIGGLALVLAGLGVYNAHQHALDRQHITELNRRLEVLELGLGGEFDEVLRRLDELADLQRQRATSVRT